MNPSSENSERARDELPFAEGDKPETLARLSVFGALGHATISFLLQRCEEVAVEKGGAFFVQGNSSDSLFVLRRGRVAIIHTTAARDHVLAELEPGTLFGEMALVGISPRTATARALEDCVALEMRHRALLELAEHDLHDFALLQMNLAREVARRLALANQALVEALEQRPD